MKDNFWWYTILLIVVILLLICSVINLFVVIGNQKETLGDNESIIEIPSIPPSCLTSEVTLQDDETLEVVVTAANAPNRIIEFRCPVCGGYYRLCIPTDQTEGTCVCDDCGAQLHWILREADER
jgi:hypothetical protein